MELYVLGRACLRTGSNAVRLRALSASQKAAPKPKPKTSHKPRTLTKAECRELSAYCERDPAEPLPPAEASRFAELLAKLDQGSESFRAQTKAQASTAAEIRQPAGEVESRASASTAARTAECGVQTDFALGFTRMLFFRGVHAYAHCADCRNTLRGAILLYCVPARKEPH